VYGLLPLAVSTLLLENEYFLQLAAVTALGAAGILTGSRLPLLDGVHRLPQVKVELGWFQLVIWGAFLAFVAVACVTADRIPFVAALQGVDAETLAVLRERFLKAREGWQASLPYVNSLLAGALVPYSLMLMMTWRHRLRWVLFAAFLVYCLSFVEKAFFLKAAIPLAYMVIQSRVRSSIRPLFVLGGALSLLLLVTVVSGVAERSESSGDEAFFSTAFTAQGPIAFLVWRALAVPVVTAGDALRVFAQEYDGQPLLGASSGLLAGALGRERVDVERVVFAAQFGQTETETGSANSVYLTEAYLNFGYPGVVAFSVLVGLLLRLLARSRDEALRSLWMLFCFGIFVAPLTGTLFSNGFLLVMAVSIFTQIGVRRVASVGSRHSGPRR